MHGSSMYERMFRGQMLSALNSHEHCLLYSLLWRMNFLGTEKKKFTFFFLFFLFARSLSSTFVAWVWRCFFNSYRYFQPLKEKNGSLVNTLSFYANLLRDLIPSISAAVLHFCVKKKYMDATVASSLCFFSVDAPIIIIKIIIL